jgi:O-antigen ligase
MWALCTAIILGFNPVLIHFFTAFSVQGFSLPFVFNFYNLKRIVELLLLVLTGVLLLSSPRLRTEVFQAFQQLSHEVQIAFGLFFGLGLLSAFFAISPISGFFGLAHDFLWVILAFVISRLWIHRSMPLMATRAFLLAISLYVILAFISYLLTYHRFAHGYLSTETLRYMTVYPQFLNPRFLAQIFILTWPILTYVSVSTWRKKPVFSLFILFINSYWFTLAIQNESRAIVLSCALACFGLLFLIRKKLLTFRLWIQFLLATLAISIFLSEIFFSIGLDMQNPFLSLLHRSQESSQYEDRLVLWNHTLNALILKYPLLGVGPLNFPMLPNPEGVAHPHNAFLQIASEWGIPAFCVFVFLVLNGVWAWIRLFRENISTVHLDQKLLWKKSMLTLIFFGGLLDSLFSGNTVMPLSQLCLAIVVGWMYALFLEQKSPILTEKQEVRPLFEGLFCAAIAASCLIVLLVMVKDLIHIHHQSLLHHSQSCKTEASCILHPLMWLPQQVTSSIES